MKKIKASLEGKDVNSYAYKISKIRIDNNLTQSELADRLGLSDKTISAWEKGKTEPDNDSVKKLCNEFGMSLSSVMFEKKTIKDHYSTMIKSLKKTCKFIWKHFLRIILGIIFILLALYFINNFNAVSIYAINYTSEDDVGLGGGYFIQSKTNNILIINGIEITDIDYEIQSTQLELYTLVNADKIVIYESDNLDDILIDELKEYPVILEQDIIHYMKNNLHLEITITDTNNTVHNYKALIVLKDYFSNNKLIYDSFKPEIIMNQMPEYINQVADSLTNKSYATFLMAEEPKELNDETNNTNKLLSIGYTYDDKTDTYIKMDGMKKIEYDEKYQNIAVRYVMNDKQYIIYYYLPNRIAYSINKNGNIIMEVNYIVGTNESDCIIGDCENYQSEIDYILKEYQSILTTLQS